MTEMEYTKLVARNLKRIAYENGKTQADIARDLHISKATVSSWMTGTRLPRMDKVDLLCHYFNCKRSDIMEEQKEPEQGWYLNEETAGLAQELFENPNYRMLFDAARGADPESMKLAADMLMKMKKTNPDG